MATDSPVLGGMAGRYASALFDLAEEQSRVAEVEQDLAKIQNLLDMSEDLRRLVRSPVFSAEDQDRALVAVLRKAGVGGLALNFFRLIAKNRRLFAAANIIKAFRALAARARGEVAAEVVSAVPLTGGHIAALKDALRASGGKDVQLTARVDPALLGGLIVRIGSRMVDSSLRTKLMNLKVVLKGVS